MKCRFLLGLLLAGLATAPATAGPTITFDEQGNGTVVGLAANPVQFQGFLSTEPVSQRTTLTYDLGKVLGSVLPAAGDVGGQLHRSQRLGAARSRRVLLLVPSRAPRGP